LSEADLTVAREAPARTDLLIVQDIFLTETAQYADVVLPAACFAEIERPRPEPGPSTGPGRR